MRKLKGSAAKIIIPSNVPDPRKQKHVFGKERAKDEVPTLETNLEETIGVRKFLISSIADAERQIGAVTMARSRLKKNEADEELVAMQLVSNYLQAQLKIIDDALLMLQKIHEAKAEAAEKELVKGTANEDSHVDADHQGDTR